jgi:hypothetical protein
VAWHTLYAILSQGEDSDLVIWGFAPDSLDSTDFTVKNPVFGTHPCYQCYPWVKSV